MSRRRSAVLAALAIAACVASDSRDPTGGPARTAAAPVPTVEVSNPFFCRRSPT